MGTLPIVTKRAARDPTTCVGCEHLAFDCNGHTVARCLHFNNVKIGEWGELDSIPKLRPKRNGCKEVARRV